MARSPAPVFSLDMFEFEGQASLEAFTIRGRLQATGWRAYEWSLRHGPELVFQRIRDLVSEFPTWQHRNKMGRRETDERDVLKCLLVRAVMDSPYRQTESHVRMAATLLDLTHVPDASTLSLKNRSLRFVHLLRRFHDWILARLPARKAIIATDATGFGPEKRCWRSTPFPYRAADERWVKMNCAVEVPQLLILNTTIMPSHRFESLAFEKTWAGLPSNVTPIRSLADSAYSGQPCLEVVAAHGAKAFHNFPENARHFAQPVLERDRMVNFAIHWPNRFKQLTARRALVESCFSAMKNNWGDRIRCRSKIGRDNEAQAKASVQNIWTLANRAVMSHVP